MCAQTHTHTHTHKDLNTFVTKTKIGGADSVSNEIHSSYLPTTENVIRFSNFQQVSSTVLELKVSLISFARKYNFGK